MISVSEYTSLADIDCALWNSLIPLGYCSARWEFLRAAEQYMGGNYSNFRYYLFYKEDTVIGAAIAYCVAVSLADLTPLSFRRFVKWLGPLQRFRVTMCGTLASDSFPGIFVLEEEFRVDILELLYRRMNQLRRDTRSIGVFYKEFSEKENGIMDFLRTKKYIQAASLPSYSLNICWKDMEEYRSALERKYRQSLSKTLKKIEDPAFSVMVVTDASYPALELYPLYEYVVAKSGWVIEKVDAGFFSEVLQQEGSTAALVVFLFEGKPVGFVSTVEDQETLQGVYLGYDPTYNEQFDLYFNLIYCMLSQAMARNKKCLVLGQTADFFKMRVGCHGTKKWFLFSLRSPVLHMMAKYFIPLLFVSPELPPRNVFKEGKS